MERSVAAETLSACRGTQLDAKTTLCRVLDAKIFKVKHERNNSRRNLGPLASLGGGSLAEPQPPKRQCNQKSQEDNAQGPEAVPDGPAQACYRHGRRLCSVVRRPTVAIHCADCHAVGTLSCRTDYRDREL